MSRQDMQRSFVYVVGCVCACGILKVVEEAVLKVAGS